jgi:CRP-like cAMP-binding protein
LKDLRHFPHTLLVLGGRERLWNIPWINGNREVFEFMKDLFVERKFKRGEKLATYQEPVDGIYFIVSGVVFLDYPQKHNDNELGEIYDSDNFEVTFDHIDKDISLRSDCLSPGSTLNVQSALLGMRRRSNAQCETAVTVSFENN